MSKKAITKGDLEWRYDCEISNLKAHIQSGASKEDLLKALEVVERRRKTIRELDSAEDFRRLLGAVFAIITAAFIRVFDSGGASSLREWLLGFGVEFIIMALAMGFAYAAGLVVLPGEELERRTLLDHLPNIGMLIGWLALIYCFCG